MSDAFDRYKDALKAGHVALLRGRLEEALAEYRTAAEIADHRPLPHASVGDVLLRMGRVDDALRAFATALGRDPDDEGALDGRARALVEAGRRGEAADVLERLAEVQAALGRHADAHATIRRALDLSESARRRRRAGELHEATRPQSPPEVDRPLRGGDALLEDAERAFLAGDRDAAVDAWIGAAAAYAADQRRDAALDASQRALGVAPGSPRVHLELARVYLERGWFDRGTEKLLLLDRLLDLDGDVAHRREVATLAARHAARDERLLGLAAAAGEGRSDLGSVPGGSSPDPGIATA